MKMDDVKKIILNTIQEIKDGKHNNKLPIFCPYCMKVHKNYHIWRVWIESSYACMDNGDVIEKQFNYELDEQGVVCDECYTEIDETFILSPYTSEEDVETMVDTAAHYNGLKVRGG